MPRRLPPFVECWRDRHGKVRVYFRRGKGERMPMPTSIGSEEFNAAYQAALGGHIDERHPRRASPQPGTLAALITSYLGATSYRGLRNTTKIGYGVRLEELRTEHGHRTVAGLNRQRIYRDNATLCRPPGHCAGPF
jgi:enterobacteria phage integrase